MKTDYGMAKEFFHFILDMDETGMDSTLGGNSQINHSHSTHHSRPWENNSYLYQSLWKRGRMWTDRNVVSTSYHEYATALGNSIVRPTKAEK